ELLDERADVEGPVLDAHLGDGDPGERIVHRVEQESGFRHDAASVSVERYGYAVRPAAHDVAPVAGTGVEHERIAVAARRDHATHHALTVHLRHDEVIGCPALRAGVAHVIPE